MKTVQWYHFLLPSRTCWYLGIPCVMIKVLCMIYTKRPTSCWPIDSMYVNDKQSCAIIDLTWVLSMFNIYVHLSVRWRSWLSHLSNTQKVPSSSLGRITITVRVLFFVYTIRPNILERQKCNLTFVFSLTLNRQSSISLQAVPTARGITWWS